MSSPGYFGHNFGPICDERTLLPTPVGEQCAMCQEDIAEGDFGVWIPHIEDLNKPPINRPAHGECMLRNVMGGIEHILAGPHAPGECYEGSKLSYRTSARQVWAYFKNGGKVPSG